MAEGKIIAFCCNWCAYAAADLAGTLKMECDEHLRVIRVMCSGMVNPSLVVEAFHRGAEGVIIMGCRPGECHYVDGNDKAMARAEMIVELLSDLGFDKKRFALHRLCAAEPEKFVAVVENMRENLMSLHSSEQER